MLRISIFTLFTIFSGLLCGQDTLNITDSKGYRQGSWQKVDSAGRVIYEGRFRDGVPDGEFRYYYPDGKLKTVSEVSKQGRRAETVSYFPNGKKMAAGNYLNEKKDSTWQFFSESNGTLVAQESYQAGIINGLSRVFYPEGGLSEQHYYKKGIKDGLWEQYYLDGKLKLRGAYKSGEKHGQFRLFYNTGQLLLEGRYNLGHQDDIWIYYDEKGVVAKKEVYDKGDLVKVDMPVN
jgi:antitoxin component YwqK of YwqJK toxin-antitoxin module